MSGAAYGIASFVDGFFKGQGIKDSREDRKLDRERQKRMDDILYAREARAVEDWNWTKAERERAREEQEFFRRAQEEAADATRKSLEETPGAAPAAVPVGQGTGIPAIVPQAAAPGSAALDRQTERLFAPGAAAPAAAPQPVPTVPRVVTDPRVDMPQGAMPEGGMTLDQAMGALGPDAIGYGQGRADPRLAAAAGMPGAPPLPPRTAPPITFAEWQKMSRTERKKAGLPTSAIGGQIYFSTLFGGDTPAAPPGVNEGMSIPAPNYDHNWFEPGGMGADVGEAASRTVQAGANVARELVPKGLDMLNGKPLRDFIRPGVNAVGEYITGNPEVMKPEPGFQDMADQLFGATPKGDPRAPTFGPGPTAPVNQAESSPADAGPRIANLPKDLTPQEAQLAETGMAEMAATTTPALRAAAAAAGGPLGAVKPQTNKDGTPKPVTEAQRNRGATAFIDRYMEVGAPMVVEALIERGRIEDATKFMDWIETRSTKAAMGNWAKAAFAISVGDFDGFAENAIEAYNRLDYFPDGTTVVKDESGFTRDKDGNVNGAKITYRDEATGNTFEQVFAGPDDLVKFGITMLAPENAFELFLQQQEAAATAAAGAAKEDAKTERELNKLILQEANKLVESSKGLDGIPTVTFEEAEATIRARMTGVEGAGNPTYAAPGAAPGAASSDVPLVYRP